MHLQQHNSHHIKWQEVLYLERAEDCKKKERSKRPFKLTQCTQRIHTSPLTPDTLCFPDARITSTTPSVHQSLTSGTTPPASVVSTGFHTNTASHAITQPSDAYSQ